MPSLLARIEYFRILIDCAAKFYISSVPLINKTITEIDQILCDFEENKVKEWRRQLNEFNKIVHEKPSEEHITKFDRNVATSLYRSIEEELTNTIGVETTGEFLRTAGKHFNTIKSLETHQSNEFDDLEKALNQIVQEQFDKIKNLWAKEKLQILCFIHSSIHDLNSYTFSGDSPGRPNFSSFFKDLIGYSHKKEAPPTDHLHQLRFNLLDLKTKVLSWPSLFELVRTFHDYYVNLIKAHSELSNFMNQYNPLYCISDKIFKNATELLSSWNNSPLTSNKCTAHDVLELTKERLTHVMSDIDQIESLLRSAIAFHEKVKNPQLIDEQQARAETFIPLLPQTGSCVYGMQGSDVTVECLSPTDWNDFFAIGDIHGELDTFQNSEVFSANRTLLPCIVNGDFIDRGIRSLETAIFLFLLQQSFPHYFIILMGNHEEEFISKVARELKQQMQGGLIKISLGEIQVSIPVLQNVINQTDKSQIQKFEELFKELFALLPIAAINSNFLTIHGGIVLPCNPSVNDFFINTREFMLNAVYNPDRDSEGLSTIDEITGTGRPVFSDCTVAGLQKMGLTALLGHQHHRANHSWGHVLNTNFGTNKSQLPCVLLCSSLPETKVQAYDIERNFQVLFPETAELQLYFQSLPKEMRCKTFGTLLYEEFSDEKIIIPLIKSIVLYLYVCICDEDHKTLSGKREIVNFFNKITNHEATAYQILVEQDKQRLMFQHGCGAAVKHMQQVLKQCGEGDSRDSISAFETLPSLVKNAETKLVRIVNQSDAKLLELLAECPSCLVNFIVKELRILIDSIAKYTKEILNHGGDKNENLAKMDAAFKNLLIFFEYVTHHYEPSEITNTKESLAYHLQENITLIQNVETELQVTNEPDTSSTQQSINFSP